MSRALPFATAGESLAARAREWLRVREWLRSRARSRTWRSWIADTVPYLAATTVLALLVQRVGARQTPLAASVLSGELPVAFAAQALLVAALGWRADPRGRWRLYLLDLAAWGPPFVYLLSTRVGGVPDVTLWVGISLFGKAAAVMCALFVAVGRGLTDTRAGLAVGAVALALYVVAIPTTRLSVLDGRAIGLTGDEPVYMVATVSLLNDHDLFLDNEYARLTYWTFYPGDLGMGHSVSARDGHIASFHDSGLSILGTVPYAIGGWTLVLSAMALLAAALLTQLYRTARIAGVAARPALLAAALTGVSLPLAAYSSQVYPEVPVALGAIVAVRQLWAQERGRRASPLVAGLALGFLPWLHVRSWPLIVVLALAAMLVWRRWADRVAVLAPILVGTLGYVALNTYVYDRVLLSPAVGGSLLQAIRSLPLSVIVIGQARPWLDGYDGLLLLAPVFVIALAAVPAMTRMGWAGLGTVAAIAVYTVLIGLWDLVSSGGWAPPGRFMVPVIPLLGVALAIGLHAMWRRRLGMLLVVPLSVWGVACSFFTFVDRAGVYVLSPLQGTVATVSSVFGVPLNVWMPHFDHPGPGSFLKVAIAIAGVAALSVLLTERTRARVPTR